MLIKIFLWPLLLTSWATSPEYYETHAFKFSAVIQYRCYAGSDGKKALDSRTKEACNNKDEPLKLNEEILRIKIKKEPNPSGNQSLVGDWKKSIDYKGRKFEVGLTLEKTTSGYSLRATASDDEPGPRRGATSLNFEHPQRMNLLRLNMYSVGQKEEISFDVTLIPAF